LKRKAHPKKKKRKDGYRFGKTKSNSCYRRKGVRLERKSRDEEKMKTIKRENEEDTRAKKTPPHRRR